MIDGLVKKIELWIIEKDLLMVLIKEEMHMLSESSNIVR